MQCTHPLRYLSSDKGFKAQGLDRKQLIYHSSLQPWLSIWGVFWTIIFILINGLSVFWDFNASDFLTACSYLFFSPRLLTCLTGSLRYQTSIFHCSSYSTVAGKSSSVRRSGNQRRWTLLPCVHFSTICESRSFYIGH